jgi:hypothetical protein
MKEKIAISIITAVLMCIAVILFVPTGRSQVSKPVQGYTLIELFTSEGCSSCPAADKLMRELQEQYGDHLLVLCYHVDYWNYLGWKDRYSSHANTEKQEYYARIFHLQSAYTPQAVVNGNKEYVGSDRSALLTEIEHGSLPDNGNIHIHARQEGSNIEVTGQMSAKDEGIRAFICLVQKQAATTVRNGENSGRTLSHINLVLDFTQMSGTNSNHSFRLPEKLSNRDLFVAAYLQNIKTGAIIAYTRSDID